MSVEDYEEKLEASRTFGQSGRMLPGDQKNPDSYKVRRAKVGGYRDYFDAEQIAWLDSYVSDNLAPSYGYSNTGLAAAAAAASGGQ